MLSTDVDKTSPEPTYSLHAYKRLLDDAAWQPYGEVPSTQISNFVHLIKMLPRLAGEAGQVLVDVC